MGLKVHELGIHLSGSLKINHTGREFVQRLAMKTGQIRRIEIWDSDSMLVTLNLFPSDYYSRIYQVGSSVPAYCTAMGKAVLSALTGPKLYRHLNAVPLKAYTSSTIIENKLLIQSLKDAR